MNSVEYQVPGISCGHCVRTIEMEVSELEGVTQVSADVDSKSVRVDFQDPVSEKVLKDRLKEIGYPIREG